MNVNAAAKRISSFLDLKLNIQAVKLIEDPAQVPENALNAHKNMDISRFVRLSR